MAHATTAFTNSSRGHFLPTSERKLAFFLPGVAGGGGREKPFNRSGYWRGATRCALTPLLSCDRFFPAVYSYGRNSERPLRVLDCTCPACSSCAGSEAPARLTSVIAGQIPLVQSRRDYVLVRTVASPFHRPPVVAGAFKICCLVLCDDAYKIRIETYDILIHGTWEEYGRPARQSAESR